MQFLDKDGLNYFWGKAKQYVDDNAVDIVAANSWEPTQEDGYTVTTVTLNKSDGETINFELKAKNGVDGTNGQDGTDGTSVNVVQATDETNAISLSTANPNNIYYWSEEE